MAFFKYKAIDLEGPAFRLIRLVRGDDDPIQCQLFEAWLHRPEGVVDYAALSYAWGGIERPYEIMVNGSRMTVTKNLYLALRYLRCQEQDRILWIDAICIDQGNDKERGHQVRQIASIYNEAERVIIWLGLATYDTDFIMHFMKQLEKKSINHACNNWKTSDKGWVNIWSVVQTGLSSVLTFRQREGLASLLGRSWFKRVWILQEVANARAAEVICGTRSVSARIFALIPSLMGITPDPHCQAVLDIMPGPSRKSSWWTQKRNLQTLLLKFGKSEASDPRDIIYALLSMSSDACDTDLLQANYEKSVQEVIHDAALFLLHFHGSGYPIHCLLDWTLPEFLENLNSLSNKVLKWALERGYVAVVKQLVERDDVNVNSKDNSAGRTPLSWAAEKGHETVVKLLIERDDVDVNSKDNSGSRTPLWWAVWRRHAAVVKLLVGRDDVDVNSKDNSAGQTPLSCAAERGHATVVRLLIGRDDVDVNSKDNRTGRTPLWWAAEGGHEAIVELLLGRDDIDVNSKNNSGRTPLW
jgi:ankyrin repeat protein